MRPLKKNSIQRECNFTRSSVVFKTFADQNSKFQLESDHFEDSRSNKFNDILNHFKKIISKVKKFYKTIHF